MRYKYGCTPTTSAKSLGVPHLVRFDQDYAWGKRGTRIAMEDKHIHVLELWGDINFVTALGHYDEE